MNQADAGSTKGERWGGYDKEDDSNVGVWIMKHMAPNTEGLANSVWGQVIDFDLPESQHSGGGARLEERMSTTVRERSTSRQIKKLCDDRL